MTTGIDYLDEAWSPVTGCQGIGCRVRDNCWARGMVRRFPQLHGTVMDCVNPGEINTGSFERPIQFEQVRFHPSRLGKPLHWKKPRRVGVCFLGDLFDEQVPFEWVDRVFETICKCRGRHEFFLLTKQPQRMAEWFKYAQETTSGWFNKGQLDLWKTYLGVSPTDQADADWMLPELLKVPGKTWLSIEPMLGPLDIDKFLHCEKCGYTKMDNMIHWDHRLCEGEIPIIDLAVLGCESGPKRRPCPHEWMIDVVRQCKSAGTPVYVKQVDMGKRVSHDPADWPEELRRRDKP